MYLVTTVRNASFLDIWWGLCYDIGDRVKFSKSLMLPSWDWSCRSRMRACLPHVTILISFIHFSVSLSLTIFIFFIMTDYLWFPLHELVFNIFKTTAGTPHARANSCYGTTHYTTVGVGIISKYFVNHCQKLCTPH